MKKQLVLIPLILFLAWMLVALNGLELAGGQLLLADEQWQRLLWGTWLFGPPVILIATYSVASFAVKNLVTVVIIIGSLTLFSSGMTQSALSGAAARLSSGAIFTESVHNVVTEKLSETTSLGTYQIKCRSGSFKITRLEKNICPGLLWVTTKTREPMLN